MNAPAKLLRLNEAARALGVSTRKLYDLMSNGELPYIQVGGSRRIAIADIDEFIERNRRAAEEASA